MKSLKQLSVVVAVCTSISLAGTGVAGANVFHGHWIGGRIEEAYHRLGGWNTFGDATTDERIAKNNGRFQVFAKDSSIYWHAGVDNGIAHQVGGRIRNKWGDLGWEGAALGYPITDERKTPDGVGRFNHFQGVPSIGLLTPMPTKSGEESETNGGSRDGKLETSGTQRRTNCLPQKRQVVTTTSKAGLSTGLRQVEPISSPDLSVSSGEA